jgi:hypothetical protein
LNPLLRIIKSKVFNLKILLSEYSFESLFNKIHFLKIHFLMDTIKNGRVFTNVNILTNPSKFPLTHFYNVKTKEKEKQGTKS